MFDLASKFVSACPLNGKSCVEGVREDFPDHPQQQGVKLKCRWWQHIAGKDPQSERIVDNFDCAVAWLPITSIEGAQMSRQTAASVDKVANEVLAVKSNIAAMGGAIRVAAAGISQAIESGALNIMLPSPSGDGSANGKEERDLS